MANYQIIVKAVLDAANLQQQLNNQVITKPINIPTNIKLNTDQIENQVKLWNNALDKMQARAPKAFSSDEVQKQVTAFQGMIAGFKAGTVPIGDMRVQLDNVRTSLAQVSSTMKGTTGDGLNFTTMLEVAAKKVLIWGIGTSLIYGTLRELKEGTQYLKDLNKEMTNIQIVTGKTDEEIQALAQTYNKLGREMAVSTLAVASASLEWARQGKTVADTARLLEATITLSKLGNMDAALSTERLTSTLNGFKLEAEDAMGVVDKLISLDNAFATSSNEITEGLSRSANSAQQASVDFNELASYITVVSSVTRKSAESIGESFNIFVD